MSASLPRKHRHRPSPHRHDTIPCIAQHHHSHVPIYTPPLIFIDPSVAAIDPPWTTISQIATSAYNRMFTTGQPQLLTSLPTLRQVNASTKSLHQRITSHYTRLRTEITTTIQSLPTTRTLSTDYIHGCIDTLTLAATLTLTTLLLRRLTTRYLTVDDIPVALVRRQANLHGVVVAVRDGDNLRVRHTPFLDRFMTVLPKRLKKVGGSSVRSSDGSAMSTWTLNVRLAGVDAPEIAHGLRPGQPHGIQARQWLRDYALGRHVRIRLHSTDQYNRAIATVTRRANMPVLRWLRIGERNIGLELLRAGYGTLYRGAGAQYGSRRLLGRYVKAEEAARKGRRGMWVGGEENVVSPMEFKKMLRERGVTAGTNVGGGVEEGRKSSGEDGDMIGKVLRATMEAYQWLRRLR